MLVKCLGCGGTFDIPDLAPAQIINMPEVTLIVAIHTQRTQCPQCNTDTLPVVMEVSMAVAAAQAPPPTKEQSRIIAPGGFHIQ